MSRVGRSIRISFWVVFVHVFLLGPSCLVGFVACGLLGGFPRVLPVYPVLAYVSSFYIGIKGFGIT